MLIRWRFEDPDNALADWTLPINPESMQAPEVALNVVATTGSLGNTFDFQDAPQPGNWQFQGVLYTLVQHDTFEGWLANGRPVLIHDHRGQTYEALFQQVDAMRAPTHNQPERHKYTAHALILRRIA